MRQANARWEEAAEVERAEETRAFEEAQREDAARGQQWRVTIAVNPYAVLTIALVVGLEVLAIVMAWPGGGR